MGNPAEEIRLRYLYRSFILRGGARWMAWLLTCPLNPRGLWIAIGQEMHTARQRR
jgi:hypothetical protein